ncbi:MAG: hypothetical protein ABSD74_01845 [Rhizomicrobium sp.]
MTELRYPAIVAILLGGLIAGTIDIGSAALINGRDIIFILHAIAGGWLGPASFDQGMRSAALGLFFQWAMSLIIASIYVAAASLVPLLRRWWIAGGIAYGIGIFFVMNDVVLPLSAYHRMPHFTAVKFAENTAAMLLFGLIVAFFARGARTSTH